MSWGERRQHSNPAEAISAYGVMRLDQLIHELPEELATIAIWLDARFNRRMEALMSEVSDAVAQITTAVAAAGDRVTAEVADLESKIADPNTTVTADDLAGLKSATDAINAIAVANTPPVDPGTGGTTPVDPNAPVDPNTPVDPNAGGAAPQ